ncbi:polysaccharide biosynthesis protein [bacterium]|nr:polysaccharide biosynthesis protein [bacterium]
MLFYSPVFLLSVLWTFTVTCSSYLLSLLLRFDFDLVALTSYQRLHVPLAVLIVARIGLFRAFGLDRGSWKYFSLLQARQMFLALVSSNVVLAAFILLVRIERYPRSVILIDLAVSLCLFAALRLAFRAHFERKSSITAGKREGAIVLGGGDSAHLLVKTLRAHPASSYEVLCILDDDKRLHGKNVLGVPIKGELAGLSKVISSYSTVSTVILAIPHLPDVTLRKLAETCKLCGVRFKKQRAFDDLLIDELAEESRIIQEEHILERETALTPDPSVAHWIAGKVILVTGAGGSIGSEISRQLLALAPRRLIFLDASELNLFELERSFHLLKSEIPCNFVLANIRDRHRLESIFDHYRPELVFHAAAYKHVPLSEQNPYEAFRTNVSGTLRLLQLSEKFSCKSFILISSDKAVNPHGVMGGTKRVAERLIQGYSDKLDTAAVRFGNVINSSGSVIPLFKRQILAGGPVTVTDPKVERYFMSVQEAVILVLAASTLGGQGDVFTLELGKKVRIFDLAERLKRELGRPDVPTIFTGLREGEQMTEDLNASSETAMKTSLKNVSKVRSPKGDARYLKVVVSLDERLEDLSDEQVRDAVRALSNWNNELMTEYITDYEERYL